MNEEMVVALGDLASSLLRNPSYKLLNDLFEQQCAADVLETKPNESAERERLYSRLQGARAFQVHLGLFASKFSELTQREEVNQDDLIDDPSVHDF